MEKWFVCNNDVVEGPFTKDDILDMVSNDRYPEDILIWGKALSVWKPYKWWLSHYDEILADVAKATDPRKWHFAYRGDSQGPLNRKDLIEELKKLKGDANEALLWTKGMTNWAPIFEFHDIMDGVGVNRRNFPRAPIQGELFIFHGDERIQGEICTISEGGFGAKNIDYDLAPGLVLKIEIHSEAVGGLIHASAQVRYLDSSSVGFKFTNINREAQSHIISFVKEKSFEIISKMKVA